MTEKYEFENWLTKVGSKKLYAENVGVGTIARKHKELCHPKITKEQIEKIVEVFYPRGITEPNTGMNIFEEGVKEVIKALKSAGLEVEEDG